MSIGASFATIRMTWPAPSKTTTGPSNSTHKTPVPTWTETRSLRPGRPGRRHPGLHKAIELDPQYAKAYNNRFARYDQGDLDAAIQDYDKAIELDPQFALAYYNRGVARSDQGDLDAAIQDYDKAIELDPQFAWAYYNRGPLATPRATWTPPSRTITRPSNSTRNSPGLRQPGYRSLDQGDLDAAIQDYDKAIELDPQYAKAYNNRGNARYDQGDLDAAIQDYTKAIELNPQ